MKERNRNKKRNSCIESFHNEFHFKFSELLPDAIRSDCSKCTPTQKRNSKKVITFLRTRRPKDWDALTTKYDPQGLFKQRVDAGLV